MRTSWQKPPNPIPDPDPPRPPPRPLPDPPLPPQTPRPPMIEKVDVLAAKLADFGDLDQV